MSTIYPVPENYPKEIIGYAEPWIVNPGDEVAIKVSSTESEYSHKAVRVIQGYQSDDGPPVKSEEITQIPGGTHKGRFQLAHAGSHSTIPDIGLKVQDAGVRFTFYVEPWLVECDHPQTLISTLDATTNTGIAVVLNPSGELDVWVGIMSKIQAVSCGFVPAKRRWMKLIVRVEENFLQVEIQPRARFTEPPIRGKTFSTTLDGTARFSTDFSELLIAAGRAKDPNDERSFHVPTNHFNGRVDTLIIEALGEDPRVLAHYDFALDMSSDFIRDTSGNNHTGALANAPSRAMKGHDWDGTESDWTKASYGYGAIHFHEDDLDDAQWETDFKIKIPQNARSGVYAIDIQGTQGDVGDQVLFFVRPTETTTAKLNARVAMIMSTFTYLAYANEHQFDPNSPARVEVPDGFESLNFYKDECFHKQDRRRDLGLALYDVHRDHSGVLFTSAKRPLLNLKPGYVNWTGHRPREISADIMMIGFLEQLGLPYDVVTDHDLHLKGIDAIKSYNTVITGCHPEYPSQASYKTYEDFLKIGGNMMYLGGNGFYWMSVTDPARPHRMEVRRGGQGVRTSNQQPGERNHSLNGKMGGLWRDFGKAANYLVGIGCCGEGAGPGVPYRLADNLFTTNRSLASWVFKGIPENQLVGENALGGFGGGASADEIDRVDFKYGSPSNIVVLASSTGHSDRFGLFPEDSGFPMMKTLGTQTEMIRSDMTYHETSGGGGVFSVGSISWFVAMGWKNYNNDIARITENVLKGFVVGER